MSEVGREMRKVNWPPPAETTRLTGVVIAVCGMVFLLLFAFNNVWGWLFDFLAGLKHAQGL